MSLDEQYACRFDVLDQPVICTNIRAIYDGIWLKELANLDIVLTDVYHSEPIELLIGPDVAGRLFSGRKYDLKCGLVVLHTFLGKISM